MSKKSGILIISCIVLVFIVVILIFSPIFKSKPMAIKVGETYQNIIMPEDPADAFDKKYRRHTYSIDVFVNQTYSFEVNSLSGGSIILFEYRDDSRVPLLTIGPGGGGVTEYDVHSAGQKILYVEVRADECPAEYSLRIIKIKES